ncbi:LysR family transcriptional regulator [Leifsonia sp. McL0607]|uniref:LysR family transcriptional regulator n=1 Tax=Leifsonia sp. McL0607 TaxID=3415672 RepID=UPI003CEA0317
MTLSQLRAFALVAKLGSLRAAAAELGISEPAVSSALAALRLDLDDALFVRSGGGIALTPGGRALADHAQEIVTLADRARWDVAHASAATPELRVLATAAFAEHAAGRLLDIFTRWVPASSVDVVVERASDVAALLRDRAYDIALGARPPAGDDGTMEVIPFLRYQRILVASPSLPLGALNGPIPLTELLAYQWFAGPAGIEEGTEEGRWLSHLAGIPHIVELTSETDALAAVRAGEGIMLALGRAVSRDVQDGALVHLPVAGTPVGGLWWATTLDRGRASMTARILQRFVTTAEATAAMVAPGGSRGLSVRGTKVHVALWA